jgi:hypothetical protein
VLNAFQLCLSAYPLPTLLLRSICGASLSSPLEPIDLCLLDFKFWYLVSSSSSAPHRWRLLLLPLAPRHRFRDARVRSLPSPASSPLLALLLAAPGLGVLGPAFLALGVVRAVLLAARSARPMLRDPRRRRRRRRLIALARRPSPPPEAPASAELPRRGTARSISNRGNPHCRRA